MSNQPRRRQKSDKTQEGIIAALRGLPGVSVEPGHDDCLVGYNLMTFWVELKSPEAISKRTGEVNPSSRTKSQKRLDRTWTGQRDYATTYQEILEIIGYPIAQE